MSARLRRARIVVPLLALVAAGGAARAQSIGQALASAYTTSAELRAERARLREVNERMPQALANTRPTIQAFGSIGSVDETTNVAVAPITTAPSTGVDSVATNLPRRAYGVSVTQPIFRGGRTLAEYREARNLIAAERARLVDVEQRVLLQAATAYFDLVQVESVHRLAASREAVLRAELVQAQGRFAAGALVRTELLSAQSAHDASVAQLAATRAQLSVARLTYVRDVGTPPETLAFPDQALPLPATSEVAVDAALHANPQITEGEETLAASRQHVRDAKGAGLPTVAVQGTLQHEEGVTYRGEVADVRAVVVQLRVPLYGGGLVASRTREARAEQDVDQAALDRLRETTTAAVAGAWEQLVAARDAQSAYAAEVAANSRAVDGIKAQQAAGERTVQDIRTAEQTLIQSEVAVIGARKDWFVAQYTLKAAVGELTARDLALDVAEYDVVKDYRKVRLGPGQ